MTTSRLKPVTCVVAVVLFLTSHAGAQLYRIDDFESLTAGTAIGGVTPNSDSGGPSVRDWATEPTTTGLIQGWLDPSGAGNMVLSAQGYSGSDRACSVSRNGSSGWIADSDDTEGTKGTLFLRFYVDSADPNVEAYFGIGTRTSSVGWSKSGRSGIAWPLSSAWMAARSHSTKSGGRSTDSSSAATSAGLRYLNRCTVRPPSIKGRGVYRVFSLECNALLTRERESPGPFQEALRKRSVGARDRSLTIAARCVSGVSSSQCRDLERRRFSATPSSMLITYAARPRRQTWRSSRHPSSRTWS